ncbi:flagellar hook protein [Solibacillus sp. R5-41]|uniref:flagellar filament capping protein FliD n=1 Tax=Solibacillus sp. R5-41 TaxID=2048654 RepID=UPI000C1286A6|nr:flagellar filament capping protein FliD [Solibacillus sp. R5-41]ATP39086.1 flagellar hook protein [Solibacillus sp. R5-41]
MVMRIGGLASGMDIDELVKKLMTAERAPLDKLFQKKTTYEWQRDAYRNVNTKTKAFDTYLADNLALKPLNSKTATSSNSNLVSAIATGKASGTLTIDGVSQLAEAGRGVGKQINATGSTKLSDLDITGTSIELSSIQKDGSMGKPVKIEFDPNTTTVDDFVKKINTSTVGVSAVYEGGKLSITSKNTGDNKAGAEVQVTGGASVFGQLGFDSLKGKETGDLASGGKNAIFEVNGVATERASNAFEINGYNVTLKSTFNNTQTIASKYTAAQTERDNAKASLETGVDGKDSLNEAARKAKAAYDAIKGGYDSKFASVLGSSALDTTEQAGYDKFNNKEFLSKLSDKDIEQLDKLNLDPNATREEMLAAISSSLDTEISPELKEKLHTLSKDQLVELSNVNETQLTNLRTEANRGIKEDNYNTLGTGFLNGLSSDEITAIQGIDFTKDDPYEGLTISDELKAKLDELSPDQKTALDNLSETDLTSFKELAAVQIPHDAAKATSEVTEAARVAGQSRLDNAEATLIKATVDAEAAGILKDGAIDDEKVNAAPKANPVTLNSTTNVDDMMKTITDFVDTYNAFVKDLTGQTKESKYRDYKPLSAEQKKDMSENEIKLWEEKAKSGLLRSDSLIQNGLTDMRSLVYQTNPGLSDSKFNSLYSIGITTSKNYNEGGTLEIDKEKLRKAIEEDPDAVEKLFKNSDGKTADVVDGKVVDTRGYVDKLRESMENMKISIEKKAGRATMTSESQYSIGKSIQDTESRIKTWERKLEMIEARYWKQFGAMESAINKANQQSSMFMQG